jgi:hypothetical protein
MRTRIVLSLLCAVACSDDGDRGRFDISQSPSTGMEDASRTVRSGDGGPSNGIGGSTTIMPRGLDASAGLDGATPNDDENDSGSASFACQTANDCAILNVGSCCGYFPRCASSNAIFSAPDCSDGVVGACGFPAIDSCACELGQCVSLQAGVRVMYP